MNKELERYLKFGGKNGYKYVEDYGELDRTERDMSFVCRHIHCYSITEIITSKEFIEAIARGIMKKCSNEERQLHLSPIIDSTTYDQAIAIRDDKLKEFINNILPN